VDPPAVSSAAKGSLVAPRRGDGLGLVDVCSECGLVGRPRLIGTISGTACCIWGRGALNAPTRGGEATVKSGEGRCWFSRFSDFDLPV